MNPCTWSEYNLVMTPSSPEGAGDAYPKMCTLAHDLFNKLAIIIGNCDLLREQTTLSPEMSERLRVIKNMAQAMSDQIQNHPCQIDAVVQANAAKAK